MSYNVGDLNLNIQAISDTTISSLDEVIKKLTIVNSMLKTTTKTSASGSIANAVSNGSKKPGQSVSKALNFGVMITKLRMATYFVKRLSFGLARVVQYGSDYTETLNKWQVAMRYNLDDADAFIKKMRTAYGISTEMLMDTQSTFKNLLSGLGGISEATSYQLSESVTQMMLDFASLYNQSIESASNKFQAMISGQIRPVRSVSGIDVSETSIYDLYTRLGGTKTMRQLNQMEKRLLRIYATFEQMQSAGATGDFEKTIEQWANQSRIMTENWQELVTWIGIGLKELLESLGVLQYVNAALITATEIVKALVYSSGYEDENFLTNMEKGVEETSDAIEELQGKLLDFDKFRAMDSGESGSPLAIDKTVLDALSSYNSQLGDVTYKAQEIANSWLKSFGFTEDENGQLTITDDKLNKIKDNLKLIGTTVGSLLGYGTIIAIGKIVKALFNIKNLLTFTKTALFGISMSLSLKFLDDLISRLDGSAKQIAAWSSVVIGVLLTILGLILAIKGGIKFGILGALAGGIGVGAVLAGIKSIEVPKFAQGGMPDKGSLFIAGEAGAEMVVNNSNGQSAVMNMAQLQSAITNGMIKALSTVGNKDGNTIIKIGDEEVFTVVQKTAKRKGLTFAKV